MSIKFKILLTLNVVMSIVSLVLSIMFILIPLNFFTKETAQGWAISCMLLAPIILLLTLLNVFFCKKELASVDVFFKRLFLITSCLNIIPQIEIAIAFGVFGF